MIEKNKNNKKKSIKPNLLLYKKFFIINIKNIISNVNNKSLIKK
jgi:hypothetical protein